MEATLEAAKRDTRGKNEARRLRAGGRIPGVVYGVKAGGTTVDSVAVAVDPKEVLRILHSESGANTLINLRLDGGVATGRVHALDPRALAVQIADDVAGELVRDGHRDLHDRLQETRPSIVEGGLEAHTAGHLERRF